MRFAPIQIGDELPKALILLTLAVRSHAIAKRMNVTKPSGFIR